MLTLFGVQPHRSKYFNIPTDPLFVDKARDIVGLCLNPSDRAVVLRVDEKTQIQALERPQPVLPLGPGSFEGITHELSHDIQRLRPMVNQCLTLVAASIISYMNQMIWYFDKCKYSAMKVAVVTLPINTRFW